eukprot:Sspe_Gene.106987::Locus_85065_Transcript_1_1_Confidence_1.000_Length_1414::g.106987::m.106987
MDGATFHSCQTYKEWVNTEDMEDFHRLAGEETWKGDEAKTGWEKYYESLRTALKTVATIFGEEEDETTAKFKMTVCMYFALKTHQQSQLAEGKNATDLLPRRTSRASISMSGRDVRERAAALASQATGAGELGEMDVIEAKSPRRDQALVLRSIDQYGELTGQLLNARVHIEKEDCAMNRVALFYSNILQLALAIVVACVGFEELDGGQFAPLIATTVAGSVAVLGSVFGFLGALGENESYLRKFLVCSFWLLSVLTSFLYVEIYMTSSEWVRCEPSLADLSPNTADGCDAVKGRHVTLIILCFIMLLIVFFGAMVTNNLLDSVNDQTALVAKNLFLTYFRTRLFEAKKFMDMWIPTISDSRRMELLDDDLVKMAQKS